MRSSMYRKRGMLSNRLFIAEIFLHRIKVKKKTKCNGKRWDKYRRHAQRKTSEALSIKSEQSEKDSL